MNLRRHWPILLVLVAYVALAVSYSLASPLYEPTDELRHFRYVRHLVVYRSLPVQHAGAPRAQSHHPPLYYALGALASWWVPVAQDVYYEPPVNPHWEDRYWEVSSDNKNQYLHAEDEQFPFRGVALAVYVVRWMTALVGAGAVWLTYRIGREILPDRPPLAVGAAAVVAFNPQFLYLSGAVNNDIPAALCGAAVILACVRVARHGSSVRSAVTLGVLYGLALLTKFHLVALIALVELAYVLALLRSGDWSALLRDNVVVLGLAALISGWWFWRNQVLYSDPTAISMVNELWAGRPVAGNWWAIGQGLPYLWSSLWGRFGYGQLPLPRIIYQGLFSFCVLALIGYLLPRRGSLPAAGMVILVAAVLIFTVAVLYYMLIQPAGARGRFLFPSLPALGLLLVVGLSRFFPPWPVARHGGRLSTAVSLAVTAGMAALALYALIGVLAPAFAQPRGLTNSEIEAVPNPTSVKFCASPSSGGCGVARLLGYGVTPTVVEPGGTVKVTVYWEALAQTKENYVVFVHLLGEAGTMVAQRDTYPGLGRYPTTIWEPGVVFADTYRLHLRETAYAPDSASVQIGVYLPDGPRLTTPDGRDAVHLSTVQIQPGPGEFPNPLEFNFGGEVALVGYTLDKRVVKPGETMHVTLFWRALAAMETDYSVFAHVLGAENQVWASSDGWPAGGSAPTSEWAPAQVVEDVRDLTVGLTTPAGFYDIEVGLHGPTGGRLPVVAEDGHRLGSRVLLSRIRVVGDQIKSQERSSE